MLTLARDLSVDAPKPGRNKTNVGTGVAALGIVEDPFALEAEWRAFEKTADGHVFQTFDFVETWLATVGTRRDMSPLIVTCRGYDGALLCLLPFGVSNCKGACLLQWLGGEHADYHCGLFAPGFLEELAGNPRSGAAFVEAVIALFKGRVHVAHFQRQPETIGGAPNPFAFYRSVPFSAKAHLTRLGDSWDAYYRSKRNSSSRRHDRLKWQKLSESATVEIIDARTPEEIDEVLTALFAQKKASLVARNVPDLFARAGVTEFYREVAQRPWPDGMSHVAAIRADGEIIATNWGLVRGDRYYYVMTAYCPGRVAAFSPGRALMYHLMGWAIDRGIHEFDFTIGDEDFKGHWCEETMTMHDSVIVLTLRGAPLGALFRAMKPAKRVVKSYPLLNRMVGRLRLFLAARR